MTQQTMKPWGINMLAPCSPGPAYIEISR